MTRRILVLSLLAGASLLPLGACASNDDSAGPGADAGGDEQAPIDADLDAGGDAGDAEPSGCAGEWCVVPLEGLRDVSVNAIWGSGPNDVWIVGTRGFAAHFDGTKWEERRASTLLSLFSVWGSGPNDVWAGNSGRSFFHWQGASWEETQMAGDDSRVVLGLSGSGADNVVALLAPSWSKAIECPGPWGPMMVACPAVFRRSRVGGELAWREAADPSFLCDNLWVEGSSTFCSDLSGLWVSPDGEPWLVGELGKAVRPRAGATPPAVAGVPSETHSITTLEAIAGTSATDVWSVGGAGTIRRYTGGPDWSITPSPTNAHLRAVWAGSAKEAWAVGEDGVVVRWDGESWEVSPTPLVGELARELRAVWGVANGDTWAAGERVLLHRKAGTQP